jgi:uncharacterized ferritin-like protein (DUF455 family)
LLPAYDGLWEAAEATAQDILARLALVPMVLEARGLDVTPATVSRFEACGDRHPPRSSIASAATRSDMSAPERNGSKACANPAN